MELNPNESKTTKLKVFSGEESFDTASDVVEEPGKWFAPHIASLITSGGRLLLAMLEKCIARTRTMHDPEVDDEGGMSEYRGWLP